MELAMRVVQEANKRRGLTDNKAIEDIIKSYDSVFDFDPLHAAEKVTGEDYHDSKETTGLGMLFHISHTARKRDLRKSMNDTFMGISVGEYIMRAEELGFETIYIEEFMSHSSGKMEKQYIMWQPVLGILLNFDTWSGCINGGHFYYNYIFDYKDAFKKGINPTSSGRFNTDQYGKLIWCGDHDCREGLKYEIIKMAIIGEFLPNWFERPWIWLLNHNDVHSVELADKHYPGKSELYQHINDKKVAALPLHVQMAISGWNYVSSPVTGI